MTSLYNDLLDGPPSHFIVIVPGYMGSKLRSKKTGEIVWIDFSTVPLNPLEWDDWIVNLFSTMRYPNEDLEPAGIVEEVLFLPPWLKQEHYGRLLVALEKMGYRADPTEYAETERNVYTFAYDWRQDNRISGRQLGEAIQKWQAFHPGAKAWLIGHSNGGIVSRWYIEKEGGADYVGKLILMGSPWDGAPKAMEIMYSGLEILFRRKFGRLNIGQLSRAAIRTFPSAYQLLPVTNPFLQDENNVPVDLFSNTNWLDNDQQSQFLQAGKKFTESLGTTLSVETLCFFGREKPTQSYGVVEFEASGAWGDIEWHDTDSGDGTVPERSAIHPNANAKFPFVVGHEDIYINPAVLEFLQWHLVDRYQAVSFAMLTTPNLAVMFEPERDFYAPHEPIILKAHIQGPESEAGNREPVAAAQITTELLWQGILPGSETPLAVPEPKEVLLSPTDEPGWYQGELPAPEQEGYYQLKATVIVPGEKPLELTELVLVEAI